MTVPIRTHPVKPTRNRTRTVRVPWRALLGIGIVAALGAAVWAVGWSPLLAVTEIPVHGVRTVTEDAIRDAVGTERTLVRIDTDVVETALLSEFAVLATVSVSRQWPHTLVVNATERTPSGIWCRGDECTLFDRTGARWGSAPPSRGTLLISVRDERPDAALPPKLFSGILAIADGLPAYGIRAMLMTLPDHAPGDVVVTTNRGYTVVLDALGDVVDQLDTLGILLAEHAQDSSFVPVNIDVRTTGRIFYR
jgi:cell division protein FtsQ